MALQLTIQATPNAPRSEILGWSEGHGDPQTDRLRVKIKAPAVEGKANAELLKFLAKSFGVRPGAVSLIRGETARWKVVAIEGITVGDVKRVLEIKHS